MATMIYRSMREARGIGSDDLQDSCDYNLTRCGFDYDILSSYTSLVYHPRLESLSFSGVTSVKERYVAGEIFSMSQQVGIERTSKDNGAVELEDINSSKNERDVDRVLTEDEKKLLKRAT